MTNELKEIKFGNKNESDSSVKITVSKAIVDNLNDLVEKVNSEFDVGRVHRQDVASWIIAQFLKSYTDHDVNLIRQSQYTDALMLESIYRRAKETGEIPDFLRDALRKQFQDDAETPKRKKALTKKSINDGLNNHEGVL